MDEAPDCSRDFLAFFAELRALRAVFFCFSVMGFTEQLFLVNVGLGFSWQLLRYGEVL